jgi:hypothetical protein
VAVQLSADKKTVVAVLVGPSSFFGHVKAVDLGANALTVGYKDAGGLQEKTLSLTRETKVLLNDGLSKGTADQEGKFADLAEGTPVLVRLSALDRRTVLDLRVQGGNVLGPVKGVDAGTNTITVTVKENGMLVDKTLNVAKNAQIEGKLSDLAAGTVVNLGLSVFDKETVVAVQVLQKE